MAEYFRGLHSLSPIRTSLPGAHGGTPGGIRHYILQIEKRGLGKEEGSETRARCRINKLCIDDDAEGNLHLEAVPRGMYEPDKTAPRLADVRDKVMFTDLRGHPTPRSNGEICAGYNGDGCTLSR